MSLDLRKDGDGYRRVTAHYGVARWGDEWCVVDAETGAQLGPPVPTRTEAREIAERRQNPPPPDGEDLDAKVDEFIAEMHRRHAGADAAATDNTGGPGRRTRYLARRDAFAEAIAVMTAIRQGRSYRD